VHLIKAFVEMALTQFGAKVKTVRSDNAIELGLSKENSEFFLSKGVIHQISCIGTPQQNGVVERKHRHLLETSRALLFHSGLPMKYWAECVLTTTYLINRFPSKVLKGLSLNQLLLGQSLNYEYLKCLGVFAMHPPSRQGETNFRPG